MISFNNFINEGRASAKSLLQNVISGQSPEVEGIKLSKEMAQAYLDWLTVSPYGKKFSTQPFAMLFKASFNWGMHRFADPASTEFKELKAKAKAMESKNESEELTEATVIMDAIDPKSTSLIKLLKKYNIKMEIIDQEGPSGYPEVELTGKRKDLEAVLASPDGWDDADLAEYIEEAVITEGKRIVLKRQYTEKHPSVTVGANATVRNRMIEAVKDGKLTKEEFNNILKEFSKSSSSWLQKNSKFFNVSEDGISLSKYGSRILSSIKLNEEETIAEGNAFIFAASKAKATGKKEFEFNGKTYKVTLKADTGLKEAKTEEGNVFVYESFSEFVNSINESNESLNEAFASAKLASILTGANKMDKDLPAAFYNMAKIALDKIQDVDIIEMDPATAKKEKRANAIYMYFTTNAKENPYAGKYTWSGEKTIPANTLLAITNGSNEWMATEWQKSYSRDTKASKTLKTTARDDSAGFEKSRSNSKDGSGISSMKQVADLADRAYCLDLDILQARYSTATQRQERTAAQKGAIAFKSDKDFKAENLSRYNTIIANRAAEMPIDKIVSDAIDIISNQIKDALVKGEKGEYGNIIVGTSKKGREVKLVDASSHMRNILDDFESYVRYTNDDAKEKEAGYDGSYYSREIKRYAKSITDRIKQIENFNYVW